MPSIPKKIRPSCTPRRKVGTFENVRSDSKRSLILEPLVHHSFQDLPIFHQKRNRVNGENERCRGEAKCCPVEDICSCGLVALHGRLCPILYFRSTKSESIVHVMHVSFKGIHCKPQAAETWKSMALERGVEWRLLFSSPPTMASECITCQDLLNRSHPAH
ncbi:hypothetical protein VTL71DRAFT_16227 [Oculimacula yallundae]|uniref:Uncharacterized protein n=1 Tax=Oculimacula yallundae TaxID=86028 RepID=A0ABR4CDU2_9HELO